MKKRFPEHLDRQRESIGEPREFANTHQGHVALIRVLHDAQVSSAWVGAAGLDHIKLAHALGDAGLRVTVIGT